MGVRASPSNAFRSVVVCHPTATAGAWPRQWQRSPPTCYPLHRWFALLTLWHFVPLAVGFNFAFYLSLLESDVVGPPLDDSGVFSAQMFCKMDCLWDRPAVAMATAPTHSRTSPYEVGRMTATRNQCFRMPFERINLSEGACLGKVNLVTIVPWCMRLWPRWPVVTPAHGI
ncbi:hypothetical protein F5148DRAFT_368387 [Russula earlei]|uniref:Uncharacterized protein n=1 Tax=Russula earlei TaxID=71964 RepID=A0ACC0U308_9AGAM|nr:hypothetical protein F5148DRAFT_368387 [Russula earlei]